jgi:hypothetical protein
MSDSTRDSSQSRRMATRSAQHISPTPRMFTFGPEVLRPPSALVRMMRAQDESSGFAAERDVLGAWPHRHAVHSDSHRAPRTTRNKRGRKPPGNIGLVWWPFHRPRVRTCATAHAARRRMMSSIRSTARLIAAYACCPHARVRTEPYGTNATVTAQATVSHVPLRLSRRRTTRAPRTCCVCWASAANTLYSA